MGNHWKFAREKLKSTFNHWLIQILCAQYNAVIKMICARYCDVIMRSSVMVNHCIEVRHRETFAKEVYNFSFFRQNMTTE